MPNDRRDAYPKLRRHPACNESNLDFRASDRVERVIGVSGSHENLPQLPDGEFLPPTAMNVVEPHLAARFRDHCHETRRNL